MYDSEPNQQTRLERGSPLYRNGQNVCFAKADPAFRRDVLDGLASRPRTIAARWIYDRVSSELLEAITALPEYGPRDARVLLQAGGWFPLAEWGDQEELFSLILATTGPDRSTPYAYRQVDALQNHGKLQPSQGFDLQSRRSA